MNSSLPLDFLLCWDTKIGDTTKKNTLLSWELITYILQASGACLLSEVIPGKAIYLTLFPTFSTNSVLSTPKVQGFFQHHPPRNDKNKILWGADTLISRQVALSTGTCVSLESQWYRPCIPLILLHVCLWCQSRNTGGVIWASLPSTCGLL